MTYAQHREWEAYQPFLPPRLRCEGDREPVEEPGVSQMAEAMEDFLRRVT